MSETESLSSSKQLIDAPDHLDSKPGEIVVAIAHVPLVIRTLNALGISADVRDSSEPLGLALLTVTGELAADRSSTAPPPAGDPLTAILQAVRKELNPDGWGWVPTMGRNRLVGHVNATDGRVIVGLGDPTEVPSYEGLAARGTVGSRGPGWVGPTSAQAGLGVRVGIADNALRRHSWFAGAWTTPSPEPLTQTARDTIRSAHATFLAGLVLTQAPAAGIEVHSVLDDDGAATSWEVAKGLVEFCGSGIDVLNLSFACYTSDGMPPLALATAIDRLDPNTVVVAAAGNFGKRGSITSPETGSIDLSVAPAWPAALDDVVAVGAMVSDPGTDTLARAPFSPNAHWVDVLAPGDPVVSSLIGGLTGGPAADSSARWRGTSFATALVTGAIAAHTVPGRFSARQAWQYIRETKLVRGADPDGPMVLDLFGQSDS